MQNLRVSIVQANLHWEDKAANLDAFDRRLAPLTGLTDLIVLPEMFTTGFSMNPAPLAEPTDGPTLEWMAQQASATGAVITGSFIAQVENRYYNRLVWMQPDGVYATYDKRHLFTLAGEHRHYAPGNNRLVVEWKGWKILPLICYDLRFPVWSRNTVGYDLLLYVANFPERRNHAWKSLLLARAVENQSYTIGVNRVGADGHDVYHSGDSMLVDYQGQILYQLSHHEGVFTTSLARNLQLNFREKFNFLADQDEFLIN